MGKLRARLHLDRDPNDPRLVGPTPLLPSLNEEPEAEVVLPEVVESTELRERQADPLRSPEWDKDEPTVVTTFLGRDPNDVRVTLNK